MKVKAAHDKNSQTTKKASCLKPNFTITEFQISPKDDAADSSVTIDPPPKIKNSEFGAIR